MPRLKIATFNINGVRARRGALLAWLERERPDIACLQELKAPDEAFPAADVERLGYGALWHGQKSWNGVAILARGAEPVERRRGLPDDPDPSQSRYLEADVHGLVVGCLYLPNGNPRPGPKFDYKLAWFDRLIGHAATLLAEGRPTVLAGDFNVVPTDELDIYDARSWRRDALLQPESREAYARMLAQGWTDALRAVHGEAKIFTFWDYFRRHFERDAGLRIDHLLLGPLLAPRLVDAGVDRWVRAEAGASDHAPAWVVLDAATAKVPAASPRPARTTAAARPVKARKRADAVGTPGPAVPKKRAPRKKVPAAGGAATGTRKARTTRVPAPAAQALDEPLRTAVKAPRRATDGPEVG